ncbi:MAG: outer membrane beta-barrel family protein [Chitinophagaceae bacterium]
MRKVYLLLTTLCFSLIVSAQKNGSIKGTAFDTVSKQPIASATISILEKKDSSLVSFTMTDNAGKFELKGIPNGEYRLLISHVNYRSSNTFFTINDEKKNVDMGSIVLNDVNKVLEEVIVSNEGPPVTIIGDTVQYNAGSFKTQPNASVEQLLKKLPGVKVEKDGTIKAQGEKVSRVLVDGKEFFGNDPKIATRNLPADAIDKVQVYDKQSDQAQLTGFEDGNYEKTINLKLKKDKKKGVFGKVTAGAGNKERYEGKFNVNSFKGARQMSAIGMANNTNAEGFSFTDILNFSGALNQLQQGGGGGGGNMSFTVSEDQAASLGLGGAQSGGINTAWGGGINYNNIIGTKLDLQSNYFYNRYNPKLQSHTLRQNNLGTTTSLYDEYKNSDNINNSQRLNLNALYQIDSFHSIRITPNFSYQKTDNRSSTRYTTTAENGNLVNNGFSNSGSGSEGYNFKNDIIFRKKFRRKGRTFSLSLNTSLNQSDGDGSLESIINYYNSGIIFRRDTLNQQSDMNSDLRGYNARAVYTEPLWRRSLLELSAGKSNTNSTSDKITYDYNKASSQYDKINKAQTNNFENSYGYNNAGIRVRTQRRNVTYSFGLTWQQAELEGKIISGIKDSVITKSFKNFLPNASFKYSFSRFKSLTINYATNTNQPSMSQLQPVPDVTNPLYIREGNPDLKQEYSHSLRTNLNLLSPYKNKNLFVYLTATATQNKIVNYDLVDLTTGIRKTRPVNVNGVYNLNGNFSYSMPVRFLKGTMEVSSNLGYNKGKQFINMIGNNIKTFSLGPELRFDMNPYDKLNLGIGASYNYNKSKYSVQSSLNNKYLSQEYNASADWQLPANFFFSTDFTYTINSQRAAGFNLKVPIWNASISKQFLKYKRGELKLSSFDLLNRNIGISRNSNQNYIEDKEVNTLRRFFMLSFTYSLSKVGLNNGGGPGGMKVIMR